VDDAAVQNGDRRLIPLNEILLWWGTGKMRMPIEEVNAMFRRLAIPSLRAAAR
jgi:hypothetical protein